MKRFARALATLAVCALSLAPEARALVGDWTSYTPLTSTRDLLVHEGSLFAACSGGVRKIALETGAETVYRNTEGLKDVSIQALAAGASGEVWASSESGFLFRLSRGQRRWETFGGSYKGAGWKMSRRAMLYRAPYLIVGSEKGLSFFDPRSGVAEANITKMASDNSVRVNSLLMVGDTLFVGTNKGIFRATLRLDRLLTNPAVNIHNPAIWSKVPGTADKLAFHPWAPPEDSVVLADTVAASADSSLNPPDAKEDFAHGLLFHTPQGIASEYSGDAGQGGGRIATFGAIRVGDEDHPNPYRFEALDGTGSRWFIANRLGLFEYYPAFGGYRHIAPPGNLPAEVVMVAAGPHGRYVYASPHVYRLDGVDWKMVPGLDWWSHHIQDASRRGANPFHVLGRDEIYLGTWGHGFLASQGGEAKSFGPQGSCLEMAIPEEDTSYSSIYAQVPYRAKGIFMVEYLVNRPYNVAYYDIASRSLSCYPVETAEIEVRGVEIIGDTLLAVVTEGGVETYRIGERDGRMEVSPKNLTPELRATQPAQAARMDKLGNLWVTTKAGSLYFVTALAVQPNHKNVLRTLEGFPGSECKGIDRDARGHLWIGCLNGGLIEVTPVADSLGHGIRRYGANDGLLSEAVGHVSVDTTTGEVWAVTDRGVARFESPSRPAVRKVSAARAYPNPFLRKHSAVVFDDLPSGSRVEVLTQSGSVVWSRKVSAGDGGQLRWDGRNAGGNRVKEGVYFFVVRSGSDVRNGKLIVAR